MHRFAAKRCLHTLHTPRALQVLAFDKLSRRFHKDYTPTTPLVLPKGHSSFLPLALSCSNLVLPKNPWHSAEPHIVGSRTPEGSIVAEEQVIPFLLEHSPEHSPVGYLRPAVAAEIEDDHQSHLISHAASPWELRYSQTTPKQLKSVAFAQWVNEGGKFTRTMHIDRIVIEWRKRKLFHEILRGWSDEAYPVYQHLPKANPDKLEDPIAFAIERAALPLFGLVNFGSLLTAYVHDPETDRVKLWVPRRAKSKRTWPGKLDVTVGGGIPLGKSALSVIMADSIEEALLDPDYVQQYIRPVGVLSFPNRSPGHWILPGMYFLYDLPLPADGSFMPRRNALDGEFVDSFELMDLDLVVKYLLEGQFKPSSAMAIIDFLIRHAYITEETDPRYLDVCRLLKIDVQLPLAWRH